MLDVGGQRRPRSAGSCAFTASTVAMMFAPGWRLMIDDDRRAGR